ncbi:MAG: transcriptional repressor [Patescibacteria group bacterium]
MGTKHDCKAELRAAGSRATPGRLALLEVLESAHRPLTVDEISNKLPELNVVTLYRALDALALAGLVRSGIGVKRTSHYEYAGRPHHHHLVCTDCGFIRQCAAC